jgi:hypothetical protein
MMSSQQRPAWRDWIVVALATGLWTTCPLAAATATNIHAPHPSFPDATHLLPPPIPKAKSPVDSFRELLAMTAAERENALTNRPPAIRARTLAKVREYAALDPNERELRLRATELRWHLLPLLHESPTNRAARLATVPDDLRPLVNSRLQQWDILPPTLQAEFFESEHALRYFTHLNSAGSPSLPPLPPGLHSGPHDADLGHWNTLSENQRQTITAQVNQFFELTPAEKQKTLNTLSDAERLQMETTLETFGQLPRAQRVQCLRAFTEFAGMSAQEKRDFLQNAQRWSQMPPKERQTWRDLVTHVPEWPPLPPPATPPAPSQLMPPRTAPLTLHAPPALATNLN